MSLDIKSNKMKGIEITSPGNPEVLVYKDFPIPKTSKNEVLIKNSAIGVNRADCLQRAGTYPVPKNSSQMLGLEVSGIIIDVGENVSDWSLGDEVCALTSGGGYAEYSIANSDHCFQIPQDYSLIESATLPEAAFTVYDNIFQRGKLSHGETLLLHGGSSGIGCFAIQLAKAMNAKVITTSSSEEKCKLCLKLGSDFSINYNTEDWVEKVLNITKGQGVNVLLDVVAGDYAEKNISVLAYQGRQITIAFQRGKSANVDFSLVMRNQLILTGSTLRPQSDERKTNTAKNIKMNVWPFIEEGKIKPVIHSTFSLRDAHKAHALMESGEHFGKIILIP